MSKRSEKTIEVSFSKRIVAVIMMFSYIFVISPLSMFAETTKTNAETKRIVSVKEEKSEVLISAKKGGTVTLGDASIEIPEGALKEDTKISITRLYKVEDTGESLYNAIPHSGGYRFLPAGTKFLKDVTITLPYSAELNAKPQSLDELYTYFYDTQKNCWIKLERLEVDKEHNKVRSLSTHFTDMINATLTMPESASPVDVNLNSIKNLEAAKPDSHLIKFNPPKASNMGDASFSFELAVPAGRKGIQPQISISYSSAGGNGIMGKGFNISYGSSITTDTRFGLPKYKTEDTYMLDGILLEEKTRKGNEITYKPLKETSFSRIKRFTSDNHWEVTDKNGTKRIYAQNKSSCVGSGSETFTWNLTKIEDVNKNTVVFEYDTFDEPNGKSYNYVYPTFIYYTGYKTDKGKYRVEFHYDENDIQREDVRIDARSKQIVTCKKLLTSITTHYGSSDAIRKYSFIYKDGLAKEKMLTSLTVSNNADENYSYTFDYNEPKVVDGKVEYFADAREWYIGKDNPLQVGNSTSLGANFNGSAGVGYGTRFIDGRITGGASGSISSGESYTEDTMMDINGDGRPDAISQDDTSVYVAINNGNGFDTAVPIRILKGGFSGDLDHETNTSSSVGWNIYGGAGVKGSKISLSAGAGYSEVYQKTSSTVLCSFMDMNRDGLVDIVESGKDYYLKNLGGLEFTEAYISSNVVVNDVSQTVSLKDRNDYQKTYYIQNPFRMWKSPYEGVISIHEKAKGVTSKLKSSIVTKTFIGDSDSDAGLEIEPLPKNNDYVYSDKSDFEIEKNKDIYFIADVGSEPKNSDIEWNLNIKYSDIKVLKKEYLSPVLMPKEISSGKTYSITEKGYISLDDYKDRCVEDFKNTLPDPLLMNLFDVSKSQVQNGNDSSYTYNVYITYSDSWRNADNIEDIYECLINTGFFFPGALTKNEFDKYVEELKNNNSNANTKEYYKQFASQFTYNVADDMFLLQPFETEEKERNFYKNYPMSKQLKKECVTKYFHDGIKTYFSEKDFSYGNKASYSVPEEQVRSENNIGTMFQRNGKALYYIGSVNKDNENSPIFYNATDKKIDCADKELSKADVTAFKELSDKNQAIVTIAYNRDKNQIAESNITFNLGNISYRAFNLSAAEFQRIVDDKDFVVDNTSVYEKYWNWGRDKVVKESEIDKLFENMDITDGEKQSLIMYLYGEHKAKMRIDSISSSGEQHEVLDYYYYTIKDNPDYVGAQKILNTYKKRVVMKEKFPFYDELKSGDFQITDFWKIEKTKDEIFELNRKEVENKVRNGNPDLDLSKTDDKTKFDNLVTDELNARYTEYCRMNSDLLSKCKKYNYAKISEISCFIDYEKEHLYGMTNNTSDLTGYYYMLQIDSDNHEGIQFVQKQLDPIKTIWDSKADFAITDNAQSYSVFEYSTVEEEDGVKYEGLASVCINSDEFLYGGINHWFYGIWKSTWTEDENGNITEDKPFSGPLLRSFMAKTDGIKDENDFKKKKPDTKKQNVTNPEHDESETDVNFYLPARQDDSSQVAGVENLKNKDISYPVSFKEALLGTVSVNTILVKESEKKVPVSEYFMPFIIGDTIHADRAGGNAYYDVEGLYKKHNAENSTLTYFENLTIPSIRKTYTEGTDKTPNISVSLGGTVPGTVSKLDDMGQLHTYSQQIASGGIGGSASKGKNISESTIKQVYQDINGDSIPDIIQVKGEGSSSYVTAVLSSGIQEDKVIYDKQSNLSGLSVLGKSTNDVDVYGGSVSPGGNVSIVPVGFKRMTPKVEQKPTPSPSGGITYSKGSNWQSEGMSDINGDGLCDYYNNNAYKINKGNGFVSDAEVFKGNGNLSEGSNQTFGMNFSIGTGADLGQAKSLSSSGSINLGLSYSFSSNNTEKMMMDINGDGLQDILRMSPNSSSIQVKYNTGNSFVDGDPIILPGWKNYVSDNKEKFLTQADSNGYDLGFIDGIPVVGTTVSKSLASVSINPFGFMADEYANSLDWNSSTTLGFSGSVGANVNIGIDIWATFVYCGTINITVSGGAGVNASTTINGVSVRMMDLDGDGLADHVLRIPGVGIYWKRNISGLYGKISRVNLPQGGNVGIDYAEKFGTPENPNFKYVMSKVTINDGCDYATQEVNHGAHSTVTIFDYGKGYYDRDAKEFYGFDKVITKTFVGYDNNDVDKNYPLYITQEDEYYKDLYYRKGFLKESNVFGASEYNTQGWHISRQTTEPSAAPYALPKLEQSWTYEKSSGLDGVIYSSSEYKYDFDPESEYYEENSYGNCREVTQNFGDGQKITGIIIYDNKNPDDYVVGLPKHIYVYDTKKQYLLRHREGSYNTLGQLTDLKQYYDKDGYSKNTITYDKYGNIESVTDKRGAKLLYTYDGDVNTFVTCIEQGGKSTDTYISKLEYDPKTQTKIYEEDCSGNTINYAYDDWQRIVEIRTDYDGKEKSKTPAVSYEYHTPVRENNGSQDLWYAVTNNKVTFDEDDGSVIQTVVQIDGLGRAVRTAKTGFVNGVDGWNISGAVEYDEKGRTVKEGMTEFVEGTLSDLLDYPIEMTKYFTSYSYDDKDRQIRTVLPDGSIQTNNFKIEDTLLVSRASDPLGNVTVQKTDSRGNIVCVEKEDKTGLLLTRVTYQYNEIGEMLKAVPVPLRNTQEIKEHPIIVEYDMLGRRTAIESSDSGRQEYFYDECSNLVLENNNVLKENNKQIVYTYDGLNRLVKIEYPDTDPTIYTYGGKNAPNKAAGKILKIQDASGTLEYEYGSLGEVKRETRTLVTHLNGLHDTITSEMKYRSDYLGRMQWIEYPDGELITYGYDNGGQVISVTGEHWNKNFEYVTNILYDQYGQRTRIDYGNGTFTEYNYDPTRRWLDTIKTCKGDATGNPLKTYQNIKYNFDAVGNVTSYENNCMDNVRGNYKTTQSYTYDSLYQLTGVEGSSSYTPDHSVVYKSTYSQVFDFDDYGLGNMVTKTSKEDITPWHRIGDDLNYELDYEYDYDNYSHRRIRAGNRYYKYDANGNIICEQDGSFESNGDDTSYHKINREADTVYSTDYGWGLFRDDSQDVNKLHSRYKRTYSWNEKNQLVLSVDANYTTSYIYSQDGERTNKYTSSSETLYFNKMWSLHTDAGNSIHGGQYAKNVYLGETRIVTKLCLRNDPRADAEELQQYFYHSDHLGSASLISDYKGDEYQRIEYTPYGETWIERTDNKGLEYLPYKFTAKELDPETGLYYYGARYLDSKYSTWISTDPALSDYIPQAPINDEAKRHNQNLPGMGGIFNHINANLYAYAANNPIKYTDPDGRSETSPFVRAEADGLNVKYYREDGSGVTRSGGSRAWRNNNPGNIRSATNEIGSAGGFAVFADYDTGFNAIITLLSSPRYSNLSIFDAISRYAPPNENDTANYQNLIAEWTGLDTSRLISDLSASELEAVANAIQRMEGYTVGTETEFSAPEEEK